MFNSLVNYRCFLSLHGISVFVFTSLNSIVQSILSFARASPAIALVDSLALGYKQFKLRDHFSSPLTCVRK